MDDKFLQSLLGLKKFFEVNLKINKSPYLFIISEILLRFLIGLHFFNLSYLSSTFRSSVFCCVKFKIWL